MLHGKQGVKMSHALIYFYVLSIQMFSYRAGFIYISYLAIALIVMSALYQTKAKVAVNPLVVYAVGLVCVFAISCLVTINSSMTVRRFVTITLMVISSYSVYVSMKNDTKEENFDFFLDMLISTCSVTFICEFLATGPQSYIRTILTGARLKPTFANANVMGVYGAIALGAVMYKIIIRKEWKKIYAGVLPLISVLASQSKKALLCFAMIGLFLLMFKYRKKKFAGLLAMFVVVLVVLELLSSTMFAPYIARFQNAFETMSGYNSGNVTDWSTAHRMMMIEDGLQFFTERPILGYGTDCYQFISQFNTYSHNNFIELLVNNGIVGFIAYYWVYLYIGVKTLRIALKRSDSRAMFVFSVMFCHVFMDIGNVSYYDKMTYVYLAWALLYIEQSRVIDG